MKILKLFMGDVRFQYRYGFYFLYAFFCVIYILILKLLPMSWSLPIGILLIFSDPSIIGLIFSGAIVHLELSEKTFDSLSIAPISSPQYLISKLLSISLICVLVSLLIGLFNGLIIQWFFFVYSILIGSMFFSLIGFTCAFVTNSLNKFFLSIIPLMMLIIIPGGLYQFFDMPIWTTIHPGIAIVEMLNNGETSILSAIFLAIWFIVLFYIAEKVIMNKMKSHKRP